jgi:hypothetical protein
MSVFLAIFVYAIMAAILATGIVLAVHGTWWLLILGGLAFILGVATVCLHPH